MSSHPSQISIPEDASRLPVTLATINDRRRHGEPLVMVTAYDFPSARAAEAAGVDLVLVGDSGAMTVLGYPSTVGVSVEEMLMLTRAVHRGLRTPFLVADLPFGSYEESDEQAVRTAMRFIKEGGADAVKLERGNATSVARARAIVQAGIPVMGHVGLTPQTSTALGGYRAQGRSAGSATRIAEELLALQDAGCFTIVLEAVPAAVTEELTQLADVPLIGIGAGPATDGQVLVFHDLLGIREGRGARFVQRYADLQSEMNAGVAAYAADVRERRYPAPEHCYSIDADELAEFRAELSALSEDKAKSDVTPRGTRANVSSMRRVPRITQVFAPRDRIYFELFEEAGENVLRSAQLLEELLSDFPDKRNLAQDIRDTEHEGDRITHEILDRLNHTFVTPIDREDILAMASALDDIVDFIEEVADYLGLYKIEAPMDQAIKLAQVLHQACTQVAEAMPQLRGFNDISAHTVEINRLENEGDRITREAIASLFDGGIDPMVVIRWKDLFERLEDAIDATERVANILAGIVIKNS